MNVIYRNLYHVFPKNTYQYVCIKQLKLTYVLVIFKCDIFLFLKYVHMVNIGTVSSYTGMLYLHYRKSIKNRKMGPECKSFLKKKIPLMVHMKHLTVDLE